MTGGGSGWVESTPLIGYCGQRLALKLIFVFHWILYTGCYFPLPFNGGSNCESVRITLALAWHSRSLKSEKKERGLHCFRDIRS